MFKKILSLAIVAMLLMSLIVVSASAADADVAAEAADGESIAAQGAEADVAPTGDSVIYFDAKTAGGSWIDDGASILFYIYQPYAPAGSDEIGSWGAKKFRGTKGDDNVWSFDCSTLGLADGTDYGIIFNNETTGSQTADLLLNSSCYGDTAYANPSVEIENTADSNKKSIEARWTNSTSCGPILCITSIGNVVGETIPSSTTGYKMMVNFLADKGKTGLTNALNYNGKDAQTTIDEIGAKLGLTQADVTKAIEEAKTTGNGTDTCDWTGKWEASKSSLPAGEGGGTTSSNAASSGTSSTSSTASKTTTTTTTTTKTGSASNTQTGQEETVLFIMLGVMVAAAGVIFFLRKKERA